MHFQMFNHRNYIRLHTTFLMLIEVSNFPEIGTLMTVNHEPWTTDDSEWCWMLDNVNSFAEWLIDVSYCCWFTIQLLVVTAS